MGNRGDRGDVHTGTRLPDEQITVLLRAARGGDREAHDRVFRLVEDDLRQRAVRLLARRRPDVLLDTTGLLHTVFLRLVGDADATWEDRNHFFRHAARVMRNFLVDLYRKSRSRKRGGGWKQSPQDPDELWQDGPSLDLLALDEALKKLAELDPTKAEIVNLHFFSRLTLAECAEILGITEGSAVYQWQFTKAWLRKELGGDESA